MLHFLILVFSFFHLVLQAKPRKFECLLRPDYIGWGLSGIPSPASMGSTWNTSSCFCRQTSWVSQGMRPQKLVPSPHLVRCHWIHSTDLALFLGGKDTCVAAAHTAALHTCALSQGRWQTNGTRNSRAWSPACISPPADWLGKSWVFCEGFGPFLIWKFCFKGKINFTCSVGVSEKLSHPRGPRVAWKTETNVPSSWTGQGTRSLLLLRGNRYAVRALTVDHLIHRRRDELAEHVSAICVVHVWLIECIPAVSGSCAYVTWYPNPYFSMWFSRKNSGSPTIKNLLQVHNSLSLRKVYKKSEHVGTMMFWCIVFLLEMCHKEICAETDSHSSQETKVESIWK